MTNEVLIHAPADSGVPESARDFGVADRVVIITGAGQGIGREFARQFAAAGAIAVVADLNSANAASVKNEIEAAGGRSAWTSSVNIGDKASRRCDGSRGRRPLRPHRRAREQRSDLRDARRSGRSTRSRWKNGNKS